MSYQEFLNSKRIQVDSVGFDIAASTLNENLKNFQQAITRWALHRGRAAIFAGTGLGKTIMELEWANQVYQHCGGNVLILAPLAVAAQTIREGAKFNIQANYCETAADIRHGLNITNYEKVDRFLDAQWGGIVLDESSILKSHDGHYRNLLTDFASRIDYRLAATATPAPNDIMEIGNHVEFLGIMSRVEMLATYFVHDGGDTSKWRLKGHAEADFWRWMCSWSVTLQHPADIGFPDDSYNLPKLNIIPHVVDGKLEAPEGQLFAPEAKGLLERRQARRASMDERVAKAAELVNQSDESWIVWCDLNDEGDLLEKSILDAVQVKGSDKESHKTKAMLDFANGDIPVLVSKPSICGFGMNWQHCHNMAFVGVSDSWEQFYQAIRRCWRFGQAEEVNVHVIYSSHEGAVVRNLQQKEVQAQAMTREMLKYMNEFSEVTNQAARESVNYTTDGASGNGWELHLGDCVEVAKSLEPDSIDYSIFSPPFASLYTYSNSERDMGNARNSDEFAEHFRFLVSELYRVLKPGRLLSFHCMNIPTTKERNGFIGIQDFRGDLIRWFQDSGFIFHSEVCIWKDPVVQMQRTKSIGLLYKQLKKDSAMSRQGIPDYLVTMRKPGTNPDPVTKDPENFPVDLWQNYASPVWMDINPGDTLQRESAREEKDERHICPLQLEVIRRAVKLWTNPGDLVLSPFAGIGSEGYVSLQEGRQFVGAELKPSYWKQAVENLKIAAGDERKQLSLLELVS